MKAQKFTLRIAYKYLLSVFCIRNITETWVTIAISWRWARKSIGIHHICQWREFTSLPTQSLAVLLNGSDTEEVRGRHKVRKRIAHEYWCVAGGRTSPNRQTSVPKKLEDDANVGAAMSADIVHPASIAECLLLFQRIDIDRTIC
jgi:hypothetical protein